MLFPKSATVCVFCASRAVVVSLNARMVSHTGLYIMYRMMRLRPHHVMSCQSLARYDENTLSLIHIASGPSFLCFYTYFFADAFALLLHCSDTISGLGLPPIFDILWIKSKGRSFSSRQRYDILYVSCMALLCNFIEKGIVKFNKFTAPKSG